MQVFFFFLKNNKPADQNKAVKGARPDDFEVFMFHYSSVLRLVVSLPNKVTEKVRVYNCW